MVGARRIPTHPSPPARPDTPGAGVFVLGVWAGLVAAALAFVLGYGPPFPRWDDFAIVPQLLGTRSVTWAWLWSPHNEHRIPLPKLVLLGVLRLARGDFRAGMLANVALLAALAFAMVRVVRRHAGGWREADAFFPLVLLHLGHHATLLASWQIVFGLSAGMAGGLLLLIGAGPEWPGLRRAAGVGCLLAFLSLCGAGGVALVPALALWLLAAAAVRLRRGGPGDRRAGLGNLLAALLPLVLVAAYFGGGRLSSASAVPRDLSAGLRTALQFLSLVFGPSAELWWPASGLVAAVLLLASVGLLARVAIVQPAERARALGLLAWFAGFGSLALGLGFGRAVAGERAGFEARYVTLAAPLGCGLYLAWDLYGGSPAWHRLVPFSLFAGMLAFLWPNTQIGLEAGARLSGEAARLERSVRAGTPMFLVIKQATPFLHPAQEALTALLPELRAARLGIFRELRPNPPFREVDLPVDPTEVRMARWEGNTAFVTGPDPLLTFVLPEPRYVAGVRVRYSHASAPGLPARFQMTWQRAGPPSEAETDHASDWNLPTGPDRSTTVWVGDAIRSFQIQPDNRPCEFRVESITLLIPEGS